jgi:hypothetical protein
MHPASRLTLAALHSSHPGFGWRRFHKEKERATWHRKIYLGRDVHVEPELLGRLRATGDKQRVIVKAVERATHARAPH